MIIGTAGAVVGIVSRIETHPNADSIWLAHVRTGAHQPCVQIVFGGMRKLRRGDLVPVAPPGSWVTVRDSAKQKKVRARNYRRQRSNGMLCSLQELGWVESGRDEVAVLRGLKPGASLDTVPVEERRGFVKNWYDAVEEVGAMVDAVLRSAATEAPVAV